MRQQALYKIIGMQKDVADSSADKQHAYDIHNMRFRHSDVNTLTALINEEGTLKARDADGNITNIKGTVIGFNTLNNQAILFTHEETGVQYVDSVTHAEESASAEQANQQILPAPPFNPLPTPLCSFRCIAGGHDKSYIASNVTIDFQTNNTEETIVFMVTRFNLNWDKYGKGDETVVVNLSLTGADNFQLMLPHSQQVFSSGIDIPANVARAASTSDPYIFYVKFSRDPEMNRDEDVVFSCQIVLTATDAVQDNDVQSAIYDAQININTTVPSLQPTPDPEPDPEPEPEPVYDPVICDYDEESPLLDKCDHIYIITTSKGKKIADNDVVTNVFEYFHGNLGFSLEHPIESTVYFENEEVQKIYWVDGIHQMRYANIAHRNGTEPWSDNLMFDSVPLLHLQEKVTVTRNNTGGMFPSGTVQWACTYMNRYGAESNIFWISHIHYSSPDDRGGAPGETCANSFTITINKYEPNGRFDYIRLYHIVHTTLDAEVAVRRVADIPVPDTPVQKEINGETVDIYPPIVYTDTNTTGEVVDPNELLYLGGISVFPNTIEQKSNTLFIGGLSQQFKYLYKLDLGIDGNSESGITFSRVSKDKSSIPADTYSGYYSHENQLRYPSSEITTFRRGETYRFGFQAQDSTGRWSDIVWIGDKCNNTASPNFVDGKLCNVHATFTLNETVVSTLRKNGYRKVRPVAVYPQPWERDIFTEGLLNPTVYNAKDRFGNSPFAQSSWFIRPFSTIDMSTVGFSDESVETETLTELRRLWGISGGSPLNKRINIDLFGNGYFAIEGFTSTDPEHQYYEYMPIPEFNIYMKMYGYSGDFFQRIWPSISIDSQIFEGHNGTELIPDGVVLDVSRYGSWAEFRHNHPLGDSQQRNGEIASMYNLRPYGICPDTNNYWYDCGYCLTFPYISGGDDSAKSFVHDYSDFYFVDQSILTMDSADIEFDNVIKSVKDLDGYSFRVVGLAPISSFISSYDIMTNTPPNKYITKNDSNDGMSIPYGLYASEVVGADMDNSMYGWRSFVNAPIWHDEIKFNTRNEEVYLNKQETPVGFAVYPWQSNGSLNNDSVGSQKVYSEAEKEQESAKDRVGENYISAELKSKILSNMHYSYRTHYIDNLDSCIPMSAYAAIFLDNQGMSLTRLAGPKNSGLGSMNYFGNVDALKTIPAFANYLNGTAGSEDTTLGFRELTRRGGYPRMVSSFPFFHHHNKYTNIDYGPEDHLAFYSPYSPMTIRNVITGYSGKAGDSSDNTDPEGFHTLFVTKESAKSLSPIQIKYKSHSHIVLSLDYSESGIQKFLGWDGFHLYDTIPFKDVRMDDAHPFWTDSSHTSCQSTKLFNDGSTVDGVETISTDGRYFKYNKFDGNVAGFMYVGQLYRNTPVPNRFGGTSPEAMERNNWLPAGDAVYLTADSECILEWSVGDTYYQRYDALRTYPFTEEDKNKIVDIVSFMTETHVNIDGRYDKNRGLTNNNHVRPTNFNLLNLVYSQKDNFFTYRTINPKKVNLDVFEYSFTWSLNKVAGALRDEWTRLTFASSYDCDGNKGPLNRIVRLDTQLVAFQEHGVAQILFNETSQVQATDGLPFELANSGKMQGLRYYTTEVGCQNKWSIAVQPNGIYWVDGRTHCMYSLGSDGIQPISTAKGFATWFQNQSDLSTVWHPGKWQGWFMHSDKTTGELFFTGSDTTLCYDTLLGEYTSFYDYQKTTAMFTVDNTVFTVAPDRSIPDTVIDLYDGKLYADHIWMHRANKEHCFIYNKQWPAWVEFVCNSNNQGNDYGTDKIFDNLEWRADAWEWNSNWDYKPFVTFDSLSGSDHYQQFAMELNAINGNAPDNNVPQLDNPAKPVNLRKKFKVWHTTMPRAKEQGAEGNWVQTRDRIRDTWCHIKLELTPALSNYRHILHDIIVTYFI